MSTRDPRGRAIKRVTMSATKEKGPPSIRSRWGQMA